MKLGKILDRLSEEPTSKLSKELLEVALNKEAASRHTIIVKKISRNKDQDSWKTTIKNRYEEKGPTKEPRNKNHNKKNSVGEPRKEL